MQTPDRIRIPLRMALSMFARYARGRFFDQFRAVFFIVLYLVLFQALMTGTWPADAWRVAVGIGLTVLGLTLFLEGLFLALMPLGERVGVKLPERTGLGLIVVFGLLLGFGSTLAEPAVAALRAMGGSVKAWEAPLLFYLLENAPWHLVAAIGIGVGVAVAVGMVRIYYGLSLKPFVFVLVPLLLGLSAYCTLDGNLRSLLGISWDSGAVTTGAVTVPMVLALGIGVSRTIGRKSSGFGIIMLASAFPILSVLILGIGLNSGIPYPRPETEFFDPANRAEALRLFDSESVLRRHAWQHGSMEGRRIVEENEQAYQRALESLATPEGRIPLIGTMPLSTWLSTQASEEERGVLAHVRAVPRRRDRTTDVSLGSILGDESRAALRAVLPLTALLLLVLRVFLRTRWRFPDELVLGIALSLFGMASLSAGIRTGLVPLGDSVGISLPRVFRSEARETERLVIEPFEMESVFTAYDSEGSPERWFYRKDHAGAWHRERFIPDRYDPDRKQYEHIVMQRPMFHPNLTFAGIGLAFLFAFGLGYGSTLAEPALRALGRKVEAISVGTIPGGGVVHAVSIGVGLGLMGGIARALYAIPLLWLLAPPYLLLLPLTWISEEDFAGIAWDCGGVTTGIVTVPLVMAMGLGLGGELGAMDGFGSLALASVYPILTVLLFGLVIRSRQHRSIRAKGKEEPHA